MKQNENKLQNMKQKKNIIVKLVYYSRYVKYLKLIRPIKKTVVQKKKSFKKEYIKSQNEFFQIQKLQKKNHSTFPRFDQENIRV